MKISNPYNVCTIKELQRLRDIKISDIDNCIDKLIILKNEKDDIDDAILYQKTYSL
jgi:hypothetical protein